MSFYNKRFIRKFMRKFQPQGLSKGTTGVLFSLQKYFWPWILITDLFSFFQLIFQEWKIAQEDFRDLIREYQNIDGETTVVKKRSNNFLNKKVSDDSLLYKVNKIFQPQLYNVHQNFIFKYMHLLTKAHHPVLFKNLKVYFHIFHAI